MRLAVLTVLAPVLVMGCAAPSTAPSAQAVSAAASPSGCRQETPIGSMLPARQCGPALSDANRQQMIDDLRKQVPPGGGKATGAGS
jgi:hypothetical protein